PSVRGLIGQRPVARMVREGVDADQGSRVRAAAPSDGDLKAVGEIGHHGSRNCHAERIDDALGGLIPARSVGCQWEGPSNEHATRGRMEGAGADTQNGDSGAVNSCQSRPPENRPREVHGAAGVIRQHSRAGKEEEVSSSYDPSRANEKSNLVSER